MGEVALRGTCRKTLLAVILALPLMALPWPALAQSLDEAASQAAAQYDAKVISAHTEQQGDKQVHVIKLLTSDGVVKIVRVTVRNPSSGGNSG